jgi:putative sigma-54 modulation protein
MPKILFADGLDAVYLLGCGEEPMKVTVRTLGMELTDAIGSHAERRVQFAIGRFGARIGAVSVRLADSNGPRGGCDKICRLVATVEGAGRVVVEDEDADLYAAIDRATTRLGRAVARAFERRRSPGGRGAREWPTFQPALARRPPSFGME